MRGKHQCVVASRAPPTGDLACNPGTCPDWESNRRPFVSQPVLNPRSYTSQGSTPSLMSYIFELEERLKLSQVSVDI